MRDEHFKVQMFRFVDVLASLNRGGEIVRHLDEYFQDMRNGYAPAIRTGVQLAKIVPWISGHVLRWNVSGMARQFIAGKNPHDVMKTLRKRYRNRIGFTVDLLGEAVVSEKEATEYAARCLDLVEVLARDTAGWADPLGRNSDLFPVVNVSVKISALYSQMNPADPADAIAHLGPKLRPILRRARDLGAFVNFDMESYAHKNTTLELFRTLFTEPEFVDWPHAGIVIQAYLKDAESDLWDLIDWGRKRNTRFTVRLVKGAYWDYERIKANQNGWPIPVFMQKPESDANFEQLSRVLLENESIVTAAFGSHNVRSIAHAQAVAEELGIDQSRFEFQLLYGMAGPIKRALVDMGYRVREYSPVGELLPGMSYLVRRLLENTSNEGFLRAKFSDNVAASELLRDPRELVPQSGNGTSDLSIAEQPARAAITSRDLPPADSRQNSPLANFVYPDSREKMWNAIEDMRTRLGREYPVVIGGDRIRTGKTIASINPSSPHQVVGAVVEAGIPEAERAVQAARRAFLRWSRRPIEDRAQLLERVARILDRRRYELSALEVFEVGKPWAEADGDIREAIDFCLFYAQQMRSRGRPRLTQQVLGEESYQHYWPRGVALIIAPWNFPMAILCGMVSAAVVTGNTVIMKPSSETPLSGVKLVEIFEQAGVPPGVVSCLPGSGRIVGDGLRDHPNVAGMTFTGSYDVGFGQLYRKFAQEFPKPCVVEMGGKNPALIMPSADLGLAVQGVHRSAFGMNGHKCSACSRVYVHRAIADEFLKRLAKSADDVVLDDPLKKGVFLGPVATAQSYEDYQRYAALARQAGDGVVRAGGAVVKDGAFANGYFVRPTVLAGLPRDHQLVREELFVPIVAVEAVDSLDQALERANDTKFGLTAGLFSREQAEIDAFFDRIQAGVVYVNRAAGATTGAWTGRVPFGGWNGSGSTGKNIGGHYTLLCYLREQSRTLCA